MECYCKRSRFTEPNACFGIFVVFAWASGLVKLSFSCVAPALLLILVGDCLDPYKGLLLRPARASRRSVILGGPALITGMDSFWEAIKGSDCCEFNPFFCNSLIKWEEYSTVAFCVFVTFVRFVMYSRFLVIRPVFLLSAPTFLPLDGFFWRLFVICDRFWNGGWGVEGVVWGVWWGVAGFQRFSFSFSMRIVILISTCFYFVCLKGKWERLFKLRQKG